MKTPVVEEEHDCQQQQQLFLIVCISSATTNVTRRRALRKSWFSFLHPLGGWRTSQQQPSAQLRFIVSESDDEQLLTEQDQHGDILFVNVAEGYHKLWSKALRSLELLQQQCRFAYYMHADDDSYVRLDLILQLLAGSPRERFYWGYIWDGSGHRVTAPIRNPSNKSYMPIEQYALDYYPPFASGCGFILSSDLVQALLKQPLPDYRLLDPPFGIHLCGKEHCVVPDGPVKPVHDDRVRPYRGIPIFQETTIIQHYLTAEEMMPFHKQVLSTLQVGQSSESTKASIRDQMRGGSAADQTAPATSPRAAADDLYAQLVQLGLLRR